MKTMGLAVTGGGVVYSGKEGADRQSCAFPSVCALSNGRWLCSFRAAPSKLATSQQRALLTWSDDDGASWVEPLDPFEAPHYGEKAGCIRGAYARDLGDGRILAALIWVDCSDPTRPFYNETTEGLLDTRICLSWSFDAGESWSKPEFMDTSPFDVPTPLTGPPLVFANGDLGCQYELNKSYDDASTWRHKSIIQVSRDGGKTWPDYTVASEDPDARIFYWDQRPSVFSDGRVLDLFWTYDRGAERYLNIHARDSRDHGARWSEYWDTGVPGQPAAPVELDDGTLAMVYVDRSGFPAIKARTSAGGGLSWPKETEIVIFESGSDPQASSKTDMREAWEEMGKFSVGLPATAKLKNGDLLVVYYAGTTPDHTGIRWAGLTPKEI